MDQGTLLKIARLRTMASRHGKGFDVVRFASDRAFARQTLTEVMDTEDEAMLVAGLQLMEALKMTTDAAPTASASTLVTAAAVVTAVSDSTESKRYVGRLR